MKVPSAARHVDQWAIVQDLHYDVDFSPGAGMLRLHSNRTQRGDQWWSGDFVDYRGIVSIMVEDTSLRLDAVANGRCYVRSWRRGFGDRTVARLCRAFLTDLVGAPPPPLP